MIEEFLGVFNNLKGYIKRNKFVLSLILGVYLLVNINISLAEYPPILTILVVKFWVIRASLNITPDI